MFYIFKLRVSVYAIKKVLLYRNSQKSFYTGISRLVHAYTTKVNTYGPYHNDCSKLIDLLTFPMGKEE